MGIIRIVAVVFVFCFSGFNAFAQHIEKYNELSRLKIVDKGIWCILDSIVFHEKKCPYYSKELIFNASIRESKNGYFMNIESLEDTNIAQGLNPFGYFYYQDHLVLVDGDLCKNLFIKTKKVKKFKYIEYDPTYQEKNKENVITIFTDDSYSQWQYWYVSGRFTLEGKTTSCN